jgi:YjbE family integral membrane protein
MDFLLNLNWVAVGQIILIDILLGGDNAIVIALACRNLPQGLRLRGILWGTAGAIILRIVLIAFAVTLLQVPYLKIAGGILLFWIGIKLLVEEDESHEGVHASERLLTAIKTVIVADFVMSVDNVIAVASAAEQSGGKYRLLLVVFGIAVSIPFIIWGSTIVLKLMERFPAIVTLGAALLGYIAGGMVLTDEVWSAWGRNYPALFDMSIPGLGIHLNVLGIVAAVAVVVLGNWRATKR